jgi:hypothetical protein
MYSFYAASSLGHWMEAFAGLAAAGTLANVECG